MTAKMAVTPHAAFPNVRKSARWNPRIIERCRAGSEGLMGSSARCYHRGPLDTVQDPRELIEAYYSAGWTDGLPVVPPSNASIEEMLAVGGLRGDEVIGEVAGRNTVVVADKGAINAVMAGRRPRDAPVGRPRLQAPSPPGLA